MTAAAGPIVQDRPSIHLSEFQNLVMYAPEDCDLFLGGGRGGGKSYAIALMFLRHAELFGGRARMLFVRRTFPGVVDFEQVTREVFGLAYGTAASYNGGAHFWRLPGGATLQLEQMETVADFEKFQGKSFSMIAVDEAGHYPDPAPIDLLRSCLRAPQPIKPRFVIAANPGGVGHGWLVRRHIRRSPPWTAYSEETTGTRFINCPSTLTDNPNIDQEAYRKQLEASTALDPELGRAWLDGDWSIARGAYFSAVLEEKRVMVEPWLPGSFAASGTKPKGGISIGSYWGSGQTAREYVNSTLARARTANSGRGAPWELFLSHDFGVSAPSVTYVCAKSPGRLGPDDRYYPRGSVILLDELATNEPGSLDRGMGYTVPRLAEEIKNLAEKWGMEPDGRADDAIFGRTGSAAGTIAAEFRRAGVTFTKAGKGERVPGWEVMRRMLQDAGAPDRPGLYVSRNCEYWWSTVPSLPRDPRKPDDVDSRAADHGADACRYALLEPVNEVPVAHVGEYSRS